MKKVSILLGLAVVLGFSSFANTGDKDHKHDSKCEKECKIGATCTENGKTFKCTGANAAKCSGAKKSCSGSAANCHKGMKSGEATKTNDKKIK